jgi:hypothetical protein
LVEAAGGSKLAFNPTTAPAVALHAGSEAGRLLPVHAVAPGQQPWFHLAAVPIAGWRPVFLLRNFDGSAIVTDDPYRMAHPAGAPADGLWRPYNGATADWQLLGYAAPAHLGFPLAGEWTAHRLDALFAGQPYIEVALTRDLMVGRPAQTGAGLAIHAGAAGDEVQSFTPVGIARQLQQSPDLKDWAPVSDWQWGLGATEQWPIAAPAAQSASRFYRLMLAPHLPESQ